MLTSADSRRRVWGLVFLLLAISMVTWGSTYLKASLKGWSFIIYWLVCAGLTCLALLTAMLDFLVIRWRGRREKKRLLHDTFSDIMPEKRKAPKKEAPSPANQESNSNAT